MDEGKEHWRSGPLIAPPRMVDAFLSSNEFLLRWWLEEERNGIVSSLRECAVTTLSSHQSRREDDGPKEDMETSTGSTNQLHLCPPVSELFAALLHSARCKCNVFLDRRSRQMYVANVIAPICSEYLDAVHAEAAWLRSTLLARPPTGTGVSVLRSANLPADELLALNTEGLKITGIERAGTLCLLLEEIKLPKQRSSDVVAFIEQVHIASGKSWVFFI